jgi:hypothetical protein
MNYSRSAAEQQAPAAAEKREEDSASVGSAIGRGAAALGGAAVGYAGAQVAGAGTQLTGALMTQLTLGMLPKMQLAEGTVNLVNNVFGLSVGLSSLVAAGAGVAAGAVVAYHAAAGAEKKDDALRVSEYQGENAKRSKTSAYFAELKDFGAELRSSLGSLKSAESFGSAAKSGFDAGSALGAPIGGAAGKIQGFGWGIALGTLASLPIAAALPPQVSAPIMIGGALLGAGLGSKAGEPIGAFCGSIAGGAVGAIGGLGYHGVSKLTGH